MCVCMREEERESAYSFVGVCPLSFERVCVCVSACWLRLHVCVGAR